jgi:hypothetical protein
MYKCTNYVWDFEMKNNTIKHYLLDLFNDPFNKEVDYSIELIAAYLLK